MAMLSDGLRRAIRVAMGAALLGSETWIVVVAGLVSAGIAVAIARLVRNRELEPEDVTIGFLGPSLAAMYLLVLALSLATEWQTIGSAQQAVSNEATAVQQLYWSTAGLPAPAAAGLRTRVRDYTETVIHHDWPLLERGTLDNRTEQMLASTSSYLLQLNPSTASGATAQQYALGQVSVIATSRSAREAAAGSRLPGGILIAVIVTSVIVSVFPFANGIRSAPVCVAVAALQAALVTVGIVVVFQLNHAYSGPLGASPAPLAEVAQQIGAS
jgi:hypothetical protein